METPRISGMDFCKLLGAAAMVLAHGGMFLSRGSGYPQPSFETQWGYDGYLLIGFFSICLPALAGSSLRAMLDKFFVGGKVLNYDIKSMIMMALSLCFFESVKNAIVYGPLAFLSWDVLHFIALSMVIITYLLIRWGVRGLYTFTVLSVLIGILGPLWLSSAGPGTEAALLLLVGAKYIARGLVFTVPTILAFFFMVSIPTSKKYFPWPVLYTIATFLGVVSTYFIWMSFKDQVFFRLIGETMPLAMFFRLPQTSGHLWPLFPWFALVAAGFILSDLYQRANNKERMIKTMLAVSVGTFVLFYIFAFQDYRDLMVDRHYFSSKVFSAPITVIVGMLSFYATLFSLFTWIFDKVRVHSQIIYNISRGLLVFYFVHFLLTFFAYHASVAVFGKRESMAYFPWAVMLISYFIMSWILKIIDRPLLIDIRRRT